MPQNTRIWQVSDTGSLSEISKTRLDSEAKLEEWLETDIGMIGDDLLVIGRQVSTDYAGVIDCLCIDSKGDLVIIELKRDLTPREVTAQVLDYASWVTDLSSDRITEIADGYLGDKGPLDVAFVQRFSEDLPESLNQSHRMLVVAGGIDSSTERIVQYLSASGIGINVITFEHFTDASGTELLSRIFLIEPEEVSTRVSAQSKRRPNITYDELEDIASENGVENLYKKLVSGLSEVLTRGTTRYTITFKGRLDSSMNTLLSLEPRESRKGDGLFFRVYSKRLARYLEVDEDDVASTLPTNAEEWAGYWDAEPGDEYHGFAGYFKTEIEVDTFLKALAKG